MSSLERLEPEFEWCNRSNDSPPNSCSKFLKQKNKSFNLLKPESDIVLFKFRIKCMHTYYSTFIESLFQHRFDFYCAQAQTFLINLTLSEISPSHTILVSKSRKPSFPGSEIVRPEVRTSYSNLI